MKTRVALIAAAVVLLAVLAAYLGWQWYSWDTVLVSTAPDGSRRATVRCYWVPVGIDGRYHYYLSFDPPVEFRPRLDIEATLKNGPSAVRDDRVSGEWATRHFIGYLQRFDGIDEDGPSSIEWRGNRVIIRSHMGVAREVELRP